MTHALLRRWHRLQHPIDQTLQLQTRLKPASGKWRAIYAVGVPDSITTAYQCGHHVGFSLCLLYPPGCSALLCSKCFFRGREAHLIALNRVTQQSTIRATPTEAGTTQRPRRECWERLPGGWIPGNYHKSVSTLRRTGT